MQNGGAPMSDQMLNPEELDQFIKELPTQTPVTAGCWQCGAICPWTNTTDPPLTRELADEWFDMHHDVCPAADWPGTEWR